MPSQFSVVISFLNKPYAKNFEVLFLLRWRRLPRSLNKILHVLFRFGHTIINNFLQLCCNRFFFDNKYAFLTVQSSRYFNEFACKGLICNGFEVVNELVSARITGCQMPTSAFFFLYKKSYNKQLNNLVRSVFTGKSQTSAWTH